MRNTRRSSVSQVNIWVIFVDIFMSLLIVALVSVEERMERSAQELLKVSKIHIELVLERGKPSLRCHGERITKRKLVEIVKMGIRESRNRKVLVVPLIDGKVPFDYIFDIKTAVLRIANRDSPGKVFWDTALAVYLKK